jgi:hypothetical protein
MRKYPPGDNHRAQHVNEVGAFNAAVATTYAFNTMPALLATLDAYREIVRAVAAGPLATTHGDLACVFCERWIGPGQSHAPDCPTVVARALLGDTP